MAKAKNAKKNKTEDKKEKEIDKLEDELEEVKEEVRVYSEDDEQEEVSDPIVASLKQIKALAWVMLAILVINTIILGSALNSNNKNANASTTSASDGTDTTENTEATEEETSDEYDVSMFTEIDADKLVDLYNSKKLSVIYFGRPTCGFCVQFLPSLQKSVEEYDYELYYVDIDKVSDDDVEKITKLDDFFEEKYGETPTVVFVKNKKIVDNQVGAADYDTYADMLEDNGIDKK